MAGALEDEAEGVGEEALEADEKDNAKSTYRT